MSAGVDKTISAGGRIENLKFGNGSRPDRRANLSSDCSRHGPDLYAMSRSQTAWKSKYPEVAGVLEGFNAVRGGLTRRWTQTLGRSPVLNVNQSHGVPALGG